MDEEKIKEIPMDKSIAEVISEHTGKSPESYRYDESLDMPDLDDLESVYPEEKE